MNVAQEELINKVARTEDIEVATVHRIFKAAGNIIFDYLSSAAPSEDITIKIWPGFTLHSEFIPAHTMEYGVQQGTYCSDKIAVKARISRPYKDKINKKLSNKIISDD